MIPFNKPFITGDEGRYFSDVLSSGKISGDGDFTKKCQNFFEDTYGFKKVLLTTSCTDALEMAAILIDIGPDDEVIMPSYTFVSTANAFLLRGAKIIFVDSNELNPNINADNIGSAITNKTKAIVVVHYAGIACDMRPIMQVADKNNLFVIEDAAQAIDSYYKDTPLGGIGHLAAFSFHESKNIISGEGGMLVINDQRFIHRAEIIREKGTNRSAFFRGDVQKYEWVDIGSSFLPAEIISSFLWAQLQKIGMIQSRRKEIWNIYRERLSRLQEEVKIILPFVPEYATNNAHMFYFVCRSQMERSKLIDFLKNHGVMAVFHYLSLHKSPFAGKMYDNTRLLNSDRYSNCLIRLPLYFELRDEEVIRITDLILEFYRSEKRE